MTAQDAERIATSFTMPEIPRKKVANTTKNKGVLITHNVNHEETDFSIITPTKLKAL